MIIYYSQWCKMGQMIKNVLAYTYLVMSFLYLPMYIVNKILDYDGSIKYRNGAILII